LRRRLRKLTYYAAPAPHPNAAPEAELAAEPQAELAEVGCRRLLMSSILMTLANGETLTVDRYQRVNGRLDGDDDEDG